MSFNPPPQTLDHPMQIRYRVDTKATQDDLIVQELHNGEQMLSRWIMHTRDHQIREALVKLGWTPPHSKPGN